MHGCLVHVDLIGEKIWVQRDGTERGIARELIEAGVLRDQIVLAFRPLDLHEQTGLVTA